ncbi:polysaccharide biosynthesis PFTS motif protein [Aquirufa aurantiipilula]
MMKGYRRLKSENRLDFLLKLKYEISNSSISSIGKCATPRIFGAGVNSAELIVRQYLVSRLLEPNFNKEILYCFGDQQRVFSYPLPPAWLQIVKDSGIKVNFFTSSLKFRWYVFTCFIGGGAVFVKYILSCIQEIIHPTYPSSKPYVFFDGLVSSNIPKSSSKPSYDILSWYLRWSNKERGLTAILHRAVSTPELAMDGIRIKSVKTTLPPLTKLASILRYTCWFIVGMMTSCLDFFMNHWWNPLIMMEAVKAKALQYVAPAELAKDYLFHNSGWIYRPLWTYEAEKKGANITFYFYSTNCENFKLPQGYSIQANFWDITNWPRYLVWNESQRDFIYRCVSKNANVLKVGSIWFQDNSDIDFQIPDNSVAVFPVQPVKASFYQSLGADFEYYVSLNTNQFLKDCYQVLKEQKSIFVLKNKRDIGKFRDKSFSKLINTIESNVDVMNLDLGISAYRVIQQSKAVISMPFTSTALIAKELGKPSCYYDPLGMIQKDDRASGGIEIVTGKEELSSWLSKVL